MLGLRNILHSWAHCLSFQSRRYDKKILAFAAGFKTQEADCKSREFQFLIHR